MLMKNLCTLVTILLLFSREKDVEVVNIRVNHFKTMGFGFPDQLIFQVQEGDQFGTDEWSNFFSPISGFDYE